MPILLAFMLQCTSGQKDATNILLALTADFKHLYRRYLSLAKTTVPDTAKTPKTREFTITVTPRKAVLRFGERELTITAAFYGAELDCSRDRPTLAGLIASSLMCPIENIMRV